MSAQVFWMLELDIKPGQLDALRALMQEMVAATEANEPGTINYEWFLSEDETKCHIYERYIDSAAVMVHLAAFGQHFAERFLGALQPTRFTVYGNPSGQVREALAAFGAGYMTEFGGYAR